MDRYPAISRRSRLVRAAIAFALLALTAGNATALADDTTIYKYIDSDGNIVFTDHPTKGAEKIEVNPPPPIPMTPVEIPETPTKPVKPNPAETHPEPKASAVPQIRMTPEGGTEPVQQDNTPAPLSQPATKMLQAPATPVPAPSTTPANNDTTAAQTTTPTPATSPDYQSLRVTSPTPGLQIAKPGGTIIVQLALTPTLNAAAGDRFRIVIDGTTMVDDSTSERHLISGLKPGQHTLVGMVIRQRNNHAQNLIESKPLIFELAKASK